MSRLLVFCFAVSSVSLQSTVFINTCANQTALFPRGVSQYPSRYEKKKCVQMLANYSIFMYVHAPEIPAAENNHRTFIVGAAIYFWNAYFYPNCSCSVICT